MIYIYIHVVQHYDVHINYMYNSIMMMYLYSRRRCIYFLPHYDAHGPQHYEVHIIYNDDVHIL
jgi:hypothetical protein